MKDVIQAMAGDTEQAASAFDERREALAKCLGKLDQWPRSLLHDYYTVSQSLKGNSKNLRTESEFGKNDLTTNSPKTKCVY